MRVFLGDSKDSRRRRSAAAVTELALVAPVLVTIMLGMFELSRAMMVKQILTDAARKGCRTGILHQYGNSDISSDVTSIMQNNGFGTSKFNPPSVGSITITVTDPNGNSLTDALDAASGSIVSVQVGIPVSSIAWFSTIFMSGSMIESDLVVMMKQ